MDLLYLVFATCGLTYILLQVDIPLWHQLRREITGRGHSSRVSITSLVLLITTFAAFCILCLGTYKLTGTVDLNVGKFWAELGLLTACSTMVYWIVPINR